MATILPNEAFPADATILGLDGTVDANTGLPYIARGVGPNSTPSYEIQYNRRQQRANGILAAVRAGQVVDEGGLMVGVYPIRYMLGGAVKTFDGATAQQVPDDATRVVYLDSANALQVQTAFPSDPTTYLPLATVVAASGAVTITDERPSVLFAVPPVGTVAQNLAYSPTFVLGGTLSVKVWEIEWVAPVDFTLVDATGRAATGPVGASLIVDVRDEGASVFSSDADRINIASGAVEDTSAVVNHVFNAGDTVTFDVKQVGSTTPGSDLTIVLNGRSAVQV